MVIPRVAGVCAKLMRYAHLPVIHESINATLVIAGPAAVRTCDTAACWTPGECCLGLTKPPQRPCSPLMSRACLLHRSTAASTIRFGPRGVVEDAGYCMASGSSDASSDCQNIGCESHTSVVKVTRRVEQRAHDATRVS